MFGQDLVVDGSGDEEQERMFGGLDTSQVVGEFINEFSINTINMTEVRLVLGLAMFELLILLVQLISLDLFLINKVLALGSQQSRVSKRTTIIDTIYHYIPHFFPKGLSVYDLGTATYDYEHTVSWFSLFVDQTVLGYSF